MRFHRLAAIAAASLLSAAIVAPDLAMADPQNGGGANGAGPNGGGPNGDAKDHKKGPPGQKSGGPGGGQKTPGGQKSQGPVTKGPANNPNATVKVPNKPVLGTTPPNVVKPKITNPMTPPANPALKNGFGSTKLPPPNVAKPVTPSTNPALQNGFGSYKLPPPNTAAPTTAPADVQTDKSRPNKWQKKPVVVNPGASGPVGTGPGAGPSKGFGNKFTKPAGGPPVKSFDELKRTRTEKTFGGGKGTVIEESDKRRIFKSGNTVVIQHDDTERLRRVNPNARFERGNNGVNISIIDRPGNYKIYSETDANGQLIRRYRRGPDGRDFIIIDNRRRRHNVGKDIAIGAGIGLGVVAGAAILNSFVDVPPPRVTIPRERYIVDYDRASDEDVYEALSAPPIEDVNEGYSLDEIRATPALRDRMRRVDLDDITFEFGSFEVDPSQYGKLERIARAMQRVIDRNPNEVFMIEGYTDAVGSREDNLSLSDRRAESVAEVLSQQFNIPYENLTTQGYGEDFLKVQTDGPERVNRRVAVRRITPLLSRGGPPPPERRGEGPGPQYSDRAPPPPPPGYSQDGPPPQDDQGRYDQGPGDQGPGDQGPGDQGPGDQGPPPGGGNYQYSPYKSQPN